MNVKGQISTEFIIIALVLFMVFLFVVGVYGNQLTGFIYSKQGYEANRIGNKLGSAINSVYLAGDGTEEKIVLEKGIDFNVSVYSNSLKVSWGTEYGNFVSKVLFTDDVTVDSALSFGGYVTVSNSNGVITVENA